MYKKTYFKFVLILFVFLLSLTFVSAGNADNSLNDDLSAVDIGGANSLESNGASLDVEVNNVDVLASNVDYDSDFSNENLLNSEDGNSLTDDGNQIANFTDLKKAIDESSTGIIDLNGNITRESGEFVDDRIIIDKNITINGNGFTINCNEGNFFKISSNGTLALNNITFINALSSQSIGSGAIYNEGHLTLNNFDFVNCSYYSINNKGILNFKNSSFIHSDKIINYGVAYFSNCNFTAKLDSHFQYTYDLWGEGYNDVSLSYFYYNIINEGDLIIDNSSFMNFSHHLISNHNLLNISNSIFLNNEALISNTGVCNIVNTQIINSFTAYLDNGGGALANRGKCSIFNSTFENNTVWLHEFANGGGAIYNEGELNLTSNVFKNNHIDPNRLNLYYNPQFSWYGNVIYNMGNLTANYNAFLNNTKLHNSGGIINDKYDIYNVGGNILSCRYNWWGSNNPDFGNLANFDIVNWIVMSSGQTYHNLELGESAVLSVNLNHLNNGNIVPDLSLLPVRQVLFNCSEGNGYLSSIVANLSDSSASTTFLGSSNRSGFIIEASIDNFVMEFVIDVDKLNSSLVFDALDIVYGDNLTVTVDVSDNGYSDFTLDGKVCVLIDGKEHFASLDEKGSCVLSIECLSAGDYVLNVSYLGNEYFSRSFASKTINVDKLQTSITVVAEDIIKGQKAKILINAFPSDIEGFASIVINNKTYKVYLKSGSATYEVRNLNDGDYIVAVYYEGTENYYGSDASTYFSVYRNITSKDDTSISVFADNVIVGENQTVRIVVGPGEVYGYGVLTVNENSFNFYVVNGSANVTLTDLALGNYVVSVSYNESYYYHASSNVTSFSVVKKYNDSNFNMDVKLSLVKNGVGAVAVDFKPYNISGNLTVGVNGYYYLVPFSGGACNFTVSLVEGSNNLVIYYPGDDDFSYKLYNETFVLSWVYDTQIVSSDLKVSAIPSAGLKSGKYLVGYLRDSNGNPLPSKVVKIAFAGKTYSVSTDAKGYFKFQVNIASSGTYKVNIDFLGDGRYKSSSRSVKVVVSKNKVKFYNPVKKIKKSKSKVKFKISLKTTGKKVLKGKKLYLKINKKTYNAKTNSKGRAVFKLKLANKKKTYKYKVTFKGDAGNLKKTYKGKLKVY